MRDRGNAFYCQTHFTVKCVYVKMCVFAVIS